MNKEELIKERNKILDSFFLNFRKKLKNRLSEIDSELDKIDMEEYSKKKIVDEALLQRIDASGKRLDALLKKLKE